MGLQTSACTSLNTRLPASSDGRILPKKIVCKKCVHEWAKRHESEVGAFSCSLLEWMHRVDVLWREGILFCPPCLDWRKRRKGVPSGCPFLLEHTVAR